VSAAGEVRVLVVDDHESFRETMRELVDATPGFVLAGEADSGETAVEVADAVAPQLVIMDKRMPGMGGAEATRRLTERHPETVVLLVSVEEPDRQVMRSGGAAAFARKQDLTPRLLDRVWQDNGSPGGGLAGSGAGGGGRGQSGLGARHPL
jgi:two-component system, NarL family, invasion response regulator UvrY